MSSSKNYLLKISAFRGVLTIASAIILVSSCNKEEPIPSYIHIEKISLSTEYVTQGSNSHKITDAWIYIDDKSVGVFELPCTVPYIGEGTHTILIGAGIKQNGVSSTRVKYPFYRYYEGAITLNRGQKTTINPTVNYFSNLTFELNPSEDFESAGSIFCDTTNTDTSIVPSTSVVFEGAKSGSVILNGSKSFYFGQTCNGYQLPGAGANVYMELNYKCNQKFVAGITSFSSSGTQIQQSGLVTINESDNWNKIYINLSDEVSAGYNAPATAFRFFFSMAKESSVSTSELYLDNIKLIH